jgi:hypothetical protein
LYGEADGVDAHATLLSIGLGVKTIDRSAQRPSIDRPVKLVAENIN